jgi:hypothetical protein
MSTRPVTRVSDEEWQSWEQERRERAQEDRARTSNGVAPVADPDRAAEKLTKLLKLPSVGLKVTAATVYGKGLRGTADLLLSNGTHITFESLRDFANHQRLALEITAATRARPVLKAAQAQEALSLLIELATHHETITSDAFARDWGADYLQAATSIPVDLSDQADRWRAFSNLEKIDPVATARQQAGSIARFSLILDDKASACRFVRCGWFLSFVRSHVGAMAPSDLANRMQRVGWLKTGSEGRIKATSPTRHAVLQWAFYAVPEGWEHDE